MLQAQDVITDDEYESQIGCYACFKEKEIAMRNSRELRAQIETRGIIMYNQTGKIESLELLLQRANEALIFERNKKTKFKDLPLWGKIKIIFVSIGVAATTFFIGQQL